MTRTVIQRRNFLRFAGAMAFAVPMLQACGGTASVAATTTATASSAAPTAAAAASSAAPTSTSAAASTTSAATTASAATSTTGTATAAAAAPAQGKVDLSIGTQDGASNDWQRDIAKQWGQQHPEVNLRVDIVPYAQAQQKTQVAMAAGTLQDVSYSPCKWFPLPASKGAYLPLDSYVRTTDPGMADFFPGTIQNGTLDGKLYALPNDFDDGNYSVVLVNLDLFQKKGIAPPTDDWTVTDYANLAAQVTDPANKVFGTDYLTGTYYDFCQVARAWGTDIVSKDGTKFQFATDAQSKAGAQWVTDLRVKLHAAPTIQDVQGTSQGIGFPGGKLAMSNVGIFSVLTTGDAVANKFKWDSVLFPKGPTGIRAFYLFSTGFAVSSRSKAPAQAYDLLVAETSKDAGILGVTKYHYTPNPRKSVFTDPQVTQVNPIFTKVFNWINSTNGPTNFPLPGNLRYAELETKWENTTPALFNGTSPFDSAIQSVQQACQAILDEARP